MANPPYISLPSTLSHYLFCFDFILTIWRGAKKKGPQFSSHSLTHTTHQPTYTHLHTEPVAHPRQGIWRICAVICQSLSLSLCVCVFSALPSARSLPLLSAVLLLCVMPLNISVWCGVGGSAYLQLKDADRAGADLKRAAELEPKDGAIQAAIRRLNQLEQEQTAKQRKAYAGMFERM